MKKIDYKNELKHLYKPSSAGVTIVDVPPMNYLMIDGQGDPSVAPRFQEAIDALFGVAHALKFLAQKEGGEIDYIVMPLEGLWWSDGTEVFNRDEKDKWQWTLMIMQPDVVSPDMYAVAAAHIRETKNPIALDRLRFDSYYEGLAAQIMHIGLYSEEGPTIARLYGSIEAEGFVRSGKHHEIYLSDMHRDAKERWRTVLRQPIRKR